MPFIYIKNKDVLLSTKEDIPWWNKESGLLSEGAIILSALDIVLYLTVRVSIDVIYIAAIDLF